MTCNSCDDRHPKLDGSYDPVMVIQDISLGVPGDCVKIKGINLRCDCDGTPSRGLRMLTGIWPE